MRFYELKTNLELIGSFIYCGNVVFGKTATQNFDALP
jgi:hypothetical protein